MSIVKKVVISRDELPSVDLETKSYNVRYRLVSEDKNRVSHWSNVFNLASPVVVPITEFSIVINGADDLVTVTWNLDQVTETAYFDVWVRWVGASAESNYPWQYLATTTNNQYSMVFPTNIPAPGGGTELPIKVRVAIQRPTYPKEKEDYPTVSEITVFQTTLETL
jgi:hypothetical protein